MKFSLSLFRTAKTANQPNPTGQTQAAYPTAGVRSATQNQKRAVQPNKRYSPILSIDIFDSALFFV